MLTDQMRASFAAQASRFLTETCTVAREVVTVGEYGESARSWVVLATDVACRLISPKFSQRLLIQTADGREDARVEYGLILGMTATALQVKDRVTVNGRALRVTQVPAQMTDLPYQRVQVSSGEAGSE